MVRKIRINTGLIALAGVLLLNPLVYAGAYTGQQQYGKQANVTLKQARHIAVKAFPGQIESQELEKEHGGSGLRYSFDIKKNNKVHEVGVDAKTGRVLENSKEGSDSD